ESWTPAGCGTPPTRSWVRCATCSPRCGARSRRPSSTTTRRPSDSLPAVRPRGPDLPDAVDGGATVPQRIAVLGAGSWGTTLAKVLADAGRDVVLWARREDVARAVREDHRNHDYLPHVELPPTIDATSDFDQALIGADAVVLGLPSQSVRSHLQIFRDTIP